MKNFQLSIVSAICGVLFSHVLQAQYCVADKASVGSGVSMGQFMGDDENGQNLRRVEFGIRYMPVFSALDFRTSNGDIVHGSVSMSHGIASMLALNITRHVGIQTELNYYVASQSYTDQHIKRDIRLSYVNIPVLLTLNTGKTKPVNLNVVAGPQFGINVGSDMQSSGGSSNDSIKAVLAVRKRDAGLAYGAGFEFALNNNHTLRLDMGYRGFFGLFNMSNNTAGDSYNVIVKSTRKTHAGYVGFSVMF